MKGGVILCGLNGSGKSTLDCLVWQVDGTRPIEENAAFLARRLQS